MSVAEPMQFETVPMDQFPLKWRFTDPRYDVLPPIHLAQVRPLAPADAGRLWNLILQSNLHAAVPFAPSHHEPRRTGGRRDMAASRRDKPGAPGRAVPR